MPPRHYVGALASPPGSDTRRRRGQDSSGDSDTINPLWPVFSTRYRCASPVLRPLPLFATHLCQFPAEVESCVAAFTDTARKVLTQFGIPFEFEDVEVLHRLRPGLDNTHTAVATLFIIAQWTEESSEKWTLAVREITNFIDDMFKARDYSGTFHVEMIAPERVNDKFLFPVLNRPDLEATWPTMKAEIQERLDAFEATRFHMTMINLFRLGYSRDCEQNPITAYISVDYESDEVEWDGIIVALENMLWSRGWSGVHVHIEHNTVDGYTFALNLPVGNASKILQKATDSNYIIQGEYPQHVNLGDSMGAQRYLLDSDGKIANPMTGTFGCYLEIRGTKSQEWVRYGLTNYHAIRTCFEGFVLNLEHPQPTATPPAGLEMDPPSPRKVMGTPLQGSELWKADRDGFRIRNSSSLTMIESPARVKHNFSIFRLNYRIDALAMNPERQAQQPNMLQNLVGERASKVAFFDEDNHAFGHVRLASGFARRAPGNNLLDWAILEVPQHRQGTNHLPSIDVWDSKYGGDYRYSPSPGACDSLLKPQPGSLRTIPPAHRVWKVGASTGPTAGDFSCFKSDCNISHSKYMNLGVSTEQVFFSVHGGQSIFCGPGDSGSIVFDVNGVALGLLFSGQLPQQAKNGYGLVTPIEDVFEDIKRMAKGAIAEIRLATS